MKTYIVHVSDGGGLDLQIPVEVADETSLGSVAQTAVVEFETQHGEALKFPIFLDIHPAEEYAAIDWMHELHRD